VVENEARRYLVIMELESSSDMQRLASDVPQIIALLKRLSNTEPVFAFKSKDGLLSGVFIRTGAAPPIIRAEFERCQGTRNGDHMMVFDIGDKVTGTSGFSRAWTWLQRH
jgi:hypothetical protein